MVYCQSLLHLRTTVYHRRMIAPADQQTDARSRHLGIFLCKVHRDLTHCYIFTLAALAEHISGCHVIMAAYSLKYIIDSQRTVVYLNSTFDNPLGKLHIYVTVVND